MTSPAHNPAGVVAETKEPKPQADANVPTQFLILPAGVTQVRVSLGPVPAPPALPSDGTIDGNVYRLSVTTLTGQPLSFRPGARSVFQVELLGTGSSREPHVEQYVDGGWVHVAFTHPENGIFQFNPSQPGEFALVLPPGHSVFGPGLTAAVAIGGALVVLGLLLVALRRRASNWADHDGEDSLDGSAEAGVGAE